MTFDYLLVGGGLQNCLIASALLYRNPAPSFVIIEKDERLGGNHTWSFHAGDVPAEAMPFVEPFIARRWPEYEVVFPGLRRTIHRSYATIRSTGVNDDLRMRIEKSSAASLYLGHEAISVEPRQVVLADGEVLLGNTVIDARGIRPRQKEGGSGWQKFLGLEVLLSERADLRHPLVMDATVEQSDGYRFMYVLPFASHHLLIEDTCYSDSPELSSEESRLRIEAYARSHGWKIDRVIGEETGVLPIPWTRLKTARASVIQGGYLGGWFHPTTGYSIPAASRLALLISQCADPSSLLEQFYQLAHRHERQARFCRLLNRMLFLGYRSQDRWRVLERFHRLPEETIERFYAMTMTRTDHFRILCGRPPKGFSPRRAIFSKTAGAS